MTEKQILKKYHETIEKSITKLLAEENIKDDIDKQNFTRGFREGFIIGFYQGTKEAQIETARNMLKTSISKEMIAELTGLSIEEIDGLS